VILLVAVVVGWRYWYQIIISKYKL